jgi:prepilin-type N-terminal cleavage/methylation domain-containing protein
MKNQKGFTLIEIVVVLAIVSILTAAAYPRISGYLENNRRQYRQNQEYIVNKTLMQYYAFTGSYYKVICETDGSIDEVNTLDMFNKLHEKTGVTIKGAGDYKYKNASDNGSGLRELKELKQVYVDFR